MTDFPALLKVLNDTQIQFIVVGGAAATAHGSARLTLDLDIVYKRSPENLHRLVAALAPHAPYLRGAPPGLPFRWDLATIRNGLNFTLITSYGAIDLLGEITGGGNYEDLLPHTEQIVVFGVPAQCLNLKKLIEVKRAAGRPKDFEATAELEQLLSKAKRSQHKP